MSDSGDSARGAVGTRSAAVFNRDFVLMLVATFGAFLNYTGLLAVVPLWAVHGGAGPAGAGLTTGVFMLITVATQPAVPWLMNHVGPRTVLAGGIVALGAPSVGYALSAALPVLITVSALRGIGFGLVTVAGAALVPALLPASVHGRGAGLYGIAVGLPNLLALPVAVWLAGFIGYPPLFVALSVIPLLAAFVVLAIGPIGRIGARKTDQVAPHPPRARGGRLAGLMSPWLVMWTSAIVAGGVITFVPIVMRDAAPFVAPVALFALSAGVLGSRWAVGVLGDRHGPGRTLPVAVVLSAVAVTLAALAVGLGFGAVQNDTLVIMFAAPSGYGVASAVWNIAYDAGTGVSAVALGVLVERLGYPVAFAAAGAGALACLPLALRHRRARVSA